jgi:hypothetical protein
MQSQPNRFNDVVTKLLSENLKFISDDKLKLDRSTCYTIYNTIFSTLVGIFEQSKAPLSNESVNYLAQQYYDGICLNGTEQGLDDSIFEQRADLKNIERRELALLAMMLRGTDFAVPILYEIKRRA